MWKLAIPVAAILCPLLLLQHTCRGEESLSLFKSHNLHCLAVKSDCVVDARGDGRHGDLDGPVALGEAGDHSLIHANRDLDKTCRETTLLPTAVGRNVKSCDGTIYV